MHETYRKTIEDKGLYLGRVERRKLITKLEQTEKILEEIRYTLDMEGADV